MINSTRKRILFHQTEDPFAIQKLAGLKADAERVFRKLGISSSEAINLFYSQVRLRKGLPFPVEIPNAVTRRTFEKTDRGEDLHEYPSLDDFFKKMGA